MEYAEVLHSRVILWENLDEIYFCKWQNFVVNQRASFFSNHQSHVLFVPDETVFSRK